MAAGDIREFPGYGQIAFQQLELRKNLEIANSTIKITSTKTIIVHVLNFKNNSMQTTLVTPTDKLGIKYLIPPVPTIEGTTHPTDMVTMAVTERQPFRLVIVNAGEANTVTIQGADTKDVTLEPHQIAQIYLTADGTEQTVTAVNPIAVLFGHPCAIRHNCTCGLLYTTLPPAKAEKQKFYIPPILAKDAEDKTFILVSEAGSTETEPFSTKTHFVEAAGTAILYRPGLLLSLIPETDFGACFVVNMIAEAKNSAVIVVHKDLTDMVHLGSLPLPRRDWEPVEGTDYVSTSVDLMRDKNVFWHSSSKMAVYHVGSKEGALFGNPAPVISKSPDFRGCAMTPEAIKIGEVADGWRESLEYCKGHDMQLVSLPQAQLQIQVANKIMQMKNDTLKEVWIGMRRSSYTGEWYWLNKKPVNDTNWAEDEPGTVHDGQCAIMSLDRTKNFGWSDDDCCKDAHPVCYRSPILFPV
ncbi:uncharacterized protein LOC109140794 [Larimichthys crocea]|uniref:uncharacterized protein LOC109140794 n=1 Tax=Larimichthys crocea TaxID=215358 RepID=UPI00090154CA|nr:uncharacterized protein LOC109140794 [Larimichthys crocea]